MRESKGKKPGMPIGSKMWFRHAENQGPDTTL